MIHFQNAAILFNTHGKPFFVNLWMREKFGASRNMPDAIFDFIVMENLIEFFLEPIYF